MANPKITIQTEREVDGRWIADVEAFPGVLAYGATREEAIQRAVALCLRVIVDRFEHGEAASADMVMELFACS